MANKIQIKRGNKSSLPKLSEGELAFTKDTKEFFIGDGVENHSFLNSKRIINDLSTGGSSNILSAEQGKKLNSIIEEILPYHIYEFKENLTNNEVPNTYQEVYALFDTLVEQYPRYVNMTVLGTTVDNEEIRQYTFTSPLTTNNSGERVDRQKILITSCIHGDERSNAIALFKFFSQVVSAQSNNILYELKENCLFRIIPICNPHGYNGNKRWNKNNVDLARNFNSNWTKIGVSGDYNYSGETVASEKETQIIQKFIDDNSYFDLSNGVTGADLLIDLHNTAQGNDEYLPNLKSQFTWFVSTTTNSAENKFMRGFYQKALQDCSMLWSNRHSALEKDTLYGMYTGFVLANIEGYGLSKNIKSCQLETSWFIGAIDSARFGGNTLRITIEMISNLLLSYYKLKDYYKERPYINVGVTESFQATNGNITKIPFNNILERTRNVLLSNNGVKVPKGYSKATIYLTTTLDKSVVSGSVEHRIYVSDDTTLGTNKIHLRNSFNIISSPSLDKVNTSQFFVTGLKTNQNINLVLVQVSDGSRTFGSACNCKIVFEE